MDVKRRMNHQNVLDQLTELFVDRGVPEYIRSDTGPEFTAQAVRDWLKAVGVKTLYIEPGSPWENGYVESFNGKLRNELLNLEVFDTLWEAMGVALAGVILTSLKGTEARLDAQIKDLRGEVGELRERMAHLEGLLEGLREAITVRAAAS